MSYSAIEKSVQSAEPVELYKISLNGETFRITSYNKPYLFLGEWYQPEQIKRGEIILDAVYFDDKFKVTIPLRSLTGRRMVQNGYEGVSTIEIIRTHVGDNDYLTLWSGKVVEIAVSTHYLDLVSMPQTYAFLKTGNRAKYSRLCRHILYSRECGVNRDGHDVQATINSQNQVLLGLSRNLNDEFLGGTLRLANGMQKLIVGIDGNVITTISPFKIDVIGQSVTIWKGCDKSLECCKNRFNNMNRFGGFPYIPVKNIFTSSANTV